MIMKEINTFQIERKDGNKVAKMAERKKDNIFVPIWLDAIFLRWKPTISSRLWFLLRPNLAKGRKFSMETQKSFGWMINDKHIWTNIINDIRTTNAMNAVIYDSIFGRFSNVILSIFIFSTQN